ncbi:unnamed protein product, partial [Prorocentrum cordatum]
DPITLGSAGGAPAGSASCPRLLGRARTPLRRARPRRRRRQDRRSGDQGRARQEEEKDEEEEEEEEEGRRGPLAGTARGAPCPAAARGGRAGASGVRPSSSCALRSALAFASSCVVTSTPSFTAPCSGVSPCLFRASIGAPRCSSRPAIST